MDSSSTTTPEKHGSETSQSVDTSIQRPEPTNPVSTVCQKEKRRREHNDSEKKRKEQIKACICKMGDLLPPSYISCERHSTLEIVEKSLNYMIEMKEAGTKFSVTEDALRDEISSLKSERDKLMDIIKAAGLSTESIPTNGVSSTTDVKADSPKPTKNKPKKRSIVNTQLQQQREKEKQQQQEMISSSVSVSEDGSSNLAGNPMMNMPSGAAFMNGQNVMFNPMMMQPGNQFMMPGMMGNGNQVVPNMGMMGPGAGIPSMQQQNNSGGITNHTPNGLSSQGDGSSGNNMNKSCDENDAAGLLQLAMQDAGITPSSASGQSGTTSAALTPSIAENTHEAESNIISQNNPLQTLASVATSNHGLLLENSAQSDTQSASNIVNNSNIPIMTSASGQTGLPAIMQQTGNNAVLNMPMMGNQQMPPQAGGGQQQLQQIMFINEQGIPIIANVPVGMDPNNPTMFQNAQKQGLIPGQNQQTVLKDPSGNNMDQNALVLAQQQANIAALQNQLMNPAAPGSNFPNMPFQQQGLIQGNLIQTPNGQLIQQIGPQMQGQIQGQGQIIGMNGQGQGIVVAGQQGPMALNTMPSQPNQLPSALILPNGQIVPVVTNPGTSGGSQAGMTLTQGQVPRMSGSQIQTDGQLMSSQGGSGLLIPAASMGGQIASTSTVASLSTSVIPTSAIQSVMTTQIQGSTVQTQKIVSSTGTQPSVSNSSQTKLVGFPAGAPNAPNMVGIQPGNKSASAPILISLPINGQPTTVLLDPITMQVLGTVQPGQQTPQPLSTGLGPVPAAVPVTSQGAVTPTVPTSTASKGKGKNNNANQRAICPKPLGADGTRGQSTPSKKKKSSAKGGSKNKETVQPDSLSDSLQIQIPESTTDPETTSAMSSESTDILAKAAQSIFSSPNGEVATVGGFYNPANEDNPLHIDTSVTEIDDENKSPVKQLNKNSNSSMVSKPSSLQENVLGLNSVADGVPGVKMSTDTSKVVNTSSVSDNVTSLSATLEEIVGMQFSDTGDSSILPLQSKSHIPMDISEPDKSSKKNKSTAKNDDSRKDSVTKGGNKSGGSKSKSKKQTVDSNNKSGLEMEKMDTDSQMDIESTLIHIPEEITFSANDLSDVLDQVEQLGSTLVDSPAAKGSTSKKSKLKRSKAADLESEPSLKKRKSGKDPVKETKTVAPPSAPRELLSMPSNLSVYDFDDSDDIVPSLLPLNGKDFNNTPSVTPTKSAEFTLNDSLDTNAKSENKNNKATAQSGSKAKPNVNIQKTSSKNAAKSTKENDMVFNKESSNPSLTGNSVIPNKDSVEVKKQNKENVKQIENKVDIVVSDPPPSMPDMDTTTSLFGFPVPKKHQRMDMAARQNANKNVSQISPKPSPQAAPLMPSPKQTIVSPKSQTSMVSPKQTGPFSPEMVSPKLSIVSPGMLSDNEHVTPSPKHYKDNSPIKKRSPPENVKVSTFSALNSVPLSDSGYGSVSNTVSKYDDKNKQSVSSGLSQATGVITSAKSMSSAMSNDVNKQQNNSAKLTELSVLNKAPLSDKGNSMNQINTSSNNMPTQKPLPLRNPGGNIDKFSAPPTGPPSQRPIPASVNSSQNNRYGPPYGSDPGYGLMSNMTVNRSMPNEPGHGPSMGPYPTPYSSESLFNPQAEKVIKSPPNVNISTLNQQKTDTSGMSKIRSNPYSVDNFVESSRDDGMRPRPDSLAAHPNLMPGSDLTNPPGDFSRMQNESSPDGFNFANIGLNLQPITSTAGSYMENSSSAPANMPSSFSFSLSSTSTTVSTSTGGLGHHQFPFFPPMLSSASNVPSSQNALPASMSNMDTSMYDQNRGNDTIPRNNTVMHPPSNSNIPRADNPPMPRGDSMPRPDKVAPPPMSDDVTRVSNIKPSCSKQKLPKAPGPASIQEPFPPYTNSSSVHDTNFFHDTQMKTNVGKSSSEPMRKPSDKPMDIGSSQSRGSSQSSIQEKRGGNMDRSPQMMNNPQSYYPPSNYPPSKSLNTPPLHHPVMMPPDDRVRNMTNRSPYESPFPPPPASQGFNNMGPSFPSNRFDNGPPSFSRDNSGTQPLSHTPVNTSGRKSANPPPQTSVVKPPQKQSAPPLVPMGGPQQSAPSQGPRPTPPQSHRATTPHGNSSQATANPSQVNQSRQSKQPSRNSKPPSKKSKALPFMEVDSNLSNSIFEPNRSMTPFFPMQNLSPQSRAMPHESSSFLPGNLFGPGPRFPNSGTPMPKNSDIGPPFNPLFPPRGAQNGLGQSFLPGFGMNMNPLHGNHGNGPQLTPHTAPHMANFSLNNIFSDGAPQNDPSLNISPIKFPHTNYQGMEHNPMQHHHQYNRGHPSVMSINSILGPNHHGFDGRMNTSMAGPFHSHGHPPFIPPLNFSMHDH